MQTQISMWLHFVQLRIFYRNSFRPSPSVAMSAQTTVEATAEATAEITAEGIGKNNSN